MPSNGPKLRVAMYGNICNNLYQIAKVLREHSQLDVHLYIEEGGDRQQMPESDDPALSHGYPDWIHKGRFSVRLASLGPWLSPLVKSLRASDVVIVSGLGPMFAPFVKRPFAFWTSGADLTVYPFPGHFRSFYHTLKRKLQSQVIGLWQRRGIRCMAEIWTQPFTPFVRALEKLAVPKNRISAAYFPVVIDADAVKRNAEFRASHQDIARDISRKFDFVVFHPSRLMILRSQNLVDSGQWKQNDVLFRGFSAFLKSSGAKRAGLVLIDRPSPDLALGKKLLSELGLAEHVLWLRPPRSFGFTRSEMINLYSASDVVADDFGAGWFGSVVLEACATECAVINYVDEDIMKTLYPWHPILSARTANDVSAHLNRLYGNIPENKRMGSLGRQWVKEFHSAEHMAKVYERGIEQMIRAAAQPA